MHAGVRTTAEFWLVGAPDSLSSQSRRNPDGFGIGSFAADGTPVVEKRPLPAFADPEFASAAHTLAGTTFVAHVRHASVGAITEANTHPFLQDGRLFAHNGGLGDLGELDRRLTELGAAGLVKGETDSERFFALITAEAAAAGGRLEAGIGAAVHWIRDRLPIVSLNFVLATPDELWALRYPSTDTLFLLQRTAGDDAGTGFVGEGTHMGAHAASLSDHDSVVVASERLNGDPRWREVLPGEVVHVSCDLDTEVRLVLQDG